ncbi:MAG: UdgX family uracil-DNA binding protein, partial [Dokdonella sp.]
EITVDHDVHDLTGMDKSVRHDVHKMRAFVRFRLVQHEGAPWYVAWFEPQHHIVELNAPFFVDRFAGMRWSILTPVRSAHWNGDALTFEAGALRSDAPSDDALEDLWRTYYANIFNPARLKVQAMEREMPVRYWKNLPEAKLIPGLIQSASSRMDAMVRKAPTTPKKIVPAPAERTPIALPAGSLAQLRREAKHCKACPLWQPATQTVFGEGPADARIVVIGEQPGDQEDLAGRPFVGPAGQLFDRALAQARIERDTLYITNTVKHFKFEPRGKRRLHARANAMEQAACRQWLLAELDRIKPAAIVCLGAMAAQAIFGASFKLMQQRGEWIALDDGTQAFATVHPSYLLRLRDAGERQSAFDTFVRDLELMHKIPK